MRNTITLNGIASTTIAGLLIQELPAISKPLMRTTIEEIDGRDGDIVTELGYSAYDKEITIGLYGSFDINAVIAYFATEGTVVFSNEPDKFYRYKIIDQIDYERLVRYRTATVKLHCQPFKYPTSETPVQLGSGQTVTAEGTDTTMQGTALAPFVDVRPKGDTEQATYTGKNLLLATSTGSPVYGILATNNSDGTVTLSGTGTENAVAPFSDTTIDLPAGTYTLSLTESLPVRTLLRDVVAAANTWVIEPGATSVTATTAATTKIRLWFYLTNGVAMNQTVGFQLEAGETASAFEPYVGGTAAPNPEYPQDVKVVTGEQTVTVTGKNLLQNTLITAPVTKNGVTITPNTDGTFTLNGTCTASAWTNFANDKIYSDFGPNAGATGVQTVDGYTLSWAIDTGEIRITHATSTGNWGLQIRSGSVYNNATLKYQLEAGTTATDWQPYQSQNYKIDLSYNLYNSSTNTTGEYLSDTGVETNSGAWAITDYIPVTAGKSYVYLGITNAGNAPYSCYYDSSKNFVSSFKQAVGRNTIIIPSGVSYVRFSIKYDEDIASFRFEDTPNQIELCKIGTYQDYIYKSGGNWYKHEAIEKVVLDGSEDENWYRQGSWSGQGTSAFVCGLVFGPNDSALSDHFTYKSSAYYNYKHGIFGRVQTNRLLFRVSDSFASTVEAFETWLSNNNTDVYYALGTATDVQITDAGLIAQLEALANANSYRDTTYITTASNGTDLPVILAVTATGKADGTVTNAGNTYAKPKLTIYGTGNIGIYLNGNQMFQIELGSEGHITIDTEKMEAYKDSESNLKNRLVTGDYSKFRLEAGANQINFSGNINKCVVENYTRWL